MSDVVDVSVSLNIAQADIDKIKKQISDIEGNISINLEGKRHKNIEEDIKSISNQFDLVRKKVVGVRQALGGVFNFIKNDLMNVVFELGVEFDQALSSVGSIDAGAIKGINALSKEFETLATVQKTVFDKLNRTDVVNLTWVQKLVTDLESLNRVMTEDTKKGASTAITAIASLAKKFDKISEATKDFTKSLSGATGKELVSFVEEIKKFEIIASSLNTETLKQTGDSINILVRSFSFLASTLTRVGKGFESAKTNMETFVEYFKLIGESNTKFFDQLSMGVIKFSKPLVELANIAELIQPSFKVMVAYLSEITRLISVFADGAKYTEEMDQAIVNVSSALVTASNNILAFQRETKKIDTESIEAVSSALIKTGNAIRGISTAFINIGKVKTDVFIDVISALEKTRAIADAVKISFSGIATTSEDMRKSAEALKALAGVLDVVGKAFTTQAVDVENLKATLATIPEMFDRLVKSVSDLKSPSMTIQAISDMFVSMSRLLSTVSLDFEKFKGQTINVSKAIEDVGEEIRKLAEHFVSLKASSSVVAALGKAFEGMGTFLEKYADSVSRIPADTSNATRAITSLVTAFQGLSVTTEQVQAFAGSAKFLNAVSRTVEVLSKDLKGFVENLDIVKTNLKAFVSEMATYVKTLGGSEQETNKLIANLRLLATLFNNVKLFIGQLTKDGFDQFTTRLAEARTALGLFLNDMAKFSSQGFLSIEGGDSSKGQLDNLNQIFSRFQDIAKLMSGVGKAINAVSKSIHDVTDFSTQFETVMGKVAAATIKFRDAFVGVTVDSAGLAATAAIFESLSVLLPRINEATVNTTKQFGFLADGVEKFAQKIAGIDFKDGVNKELLTLIKSTSTLINAMDKFGIVSDEKMTNLTTSIKTVIGSFEEFNGVSKKTASAMESVATVARSINTIVENLTQSDQTLEKYFSKAGEAIGHFVKEFQKVLSISTSVGGDKALLFSEEEVSRLTAIGSLMSGVSDIFKSLHGETSVFATNVNKLGTAFKAMSRFLGDIIKKAKDLRGLRDEVGAISKLFQQTAGMINATTAMTGKFEDKITEIGVAIAGVDLNKFATIEPTALNSVSKFFASVKNLASAIKQIGSLSDSEIGKFQENLKKLIPSIQGLKNSMVSFGATTTKTFNSAAASSTKTLESFGKIARFFGFGSTIYYAVGQLRSFMTEFIGEINEMSRQFVNFVAIAGGSMESLGDAIQRVNEISTEFAQKQSDVAGAMTQLAKAGFTQAESFEAIRDVTALAQATMEGMEESVQATTTILKAFQISTEETGRITNTLAAGILNSKISLTDFNTALNYAASSAAVANVSFEATVASIMALADVGVRAGTIGTTLRGVLAALINPSAKLRAVLNQLNLTIDQVNPLTHDFVDVLRTLRDAGFSSAQAFQAFERRVATGAAVLIQNADKVGKFRSEVTGTTAAIDTANAQMESFANTATRFANYFMEKLAPALDVVLSGLKGFMDFMMRSELLTTAFLSAIGLLVGGFGLSYLGKLLIGVKEKFYGYTDSLMKAKAGTDALKTSTNELAAAQVNLANASMGVEVVNNEVTKAVKASDRLKASLSGIGASMKSLAASFATGAIFAAATATIGFLVKSVMDAIDSIYQMELASKKLSNAQKQLAGFVKSTTQEIAGSIPAMKEYLAVQEAIARFGKTGLASGLLEKDIYVSIANGLDEAVESGKDVEAQLSQLAKMQAALTLAGKDWSNEISVSPELYAKVVRKANEILSDEQKRNALLNEANIDLQIQFNQAVRLQKQADAFFHSWQGAKDIWKDTSGLEKFEAAFAWLPGVSYWLRDFGDFQDEMAAEKWEGVYALADAINKADENMKDFSEELDKSSKLQKQLGQGGKVILSSIESIGMVMDAINKLNKDDVDYMKKKIALETILAHQNKELANIFNGQFEFIKKQRKEIELQMQGWDAVVRSQYGLQDTTGNIKELYAGMNEELGLAILKVDELNTISGELSNKITALSDAFIAMQAYAADGLSSVFSPDAIISASGKILADSQETILRKFEELGLVEEEAYIKLKKISEFALDQTGFYEGLVKSDEKIVDTVHSLNLLNSSLGNTNKFKFPEMFAEKELAKIKEAKAEIEKLKASIPASGIDIFDTSVGMGGGEEAMMEGSASRSAELVKNTQRLAELEKQINGIRASSIEYLTKQNTKASELQRLYASTEEALSGVNIELERGIQRQRMLVSSIEMQEQAIKRVKDQLSKNQAEYQLAQQYSTRQIASDTTLGQLLQQRAKLEKEIADDRARGYSTYSQEVKLEKLNLKIQEEANDVVARQEFNQKRLANLEKRKAADQEELQKQQKINGEIRNQQKALLASLGIEKSLLDAKTAYKTLMEDETATDAEKKEAAAEYLELMKTAGEELLDIQTQLGDETGEGTDKVKELSEQYDTMGKNVAGVLESYSQMNKESSDDLEKAQEMIGYIKQQALAIVEKTTKEKANTEEMKKSLAVLDEYEAVLETIEKLSSGIATAWAGTANSIKEGLKALKEMAGVDSDVKRNASGNADAQKDSSDSDSDVDTTPTETRGNIQRFLDFLSNANSFGLQSFNASRGQNINVQGMFDRMANTLTGISTPSTMNMNMQPIYLQIGNANYPVMADSSVANSLVRTLRQEKRMRRR